MIFQPIGTKVFIEKQLHLGLNPSGNMYSISDIIVHLPVCLLRWPEGRPHLVCYFTMSLADAVMVSGHPESKGCHIEPCVWVGWIEAQTNEIISLQT